MIVVQNQVVPAEKMLVLWDQHLHNLVSGIVDERTRTDIWICYEDWVCAPKAGPLVLNAYEKHFKKWEDLFLALKGNVAAANCRNLEEELALRVLGNLEAYEKFVLDKVLEKIHELAKKLGMLEKWSQEKYYGPAADAIWSESFETSLKAVKMKESLPRLYTEIAAIHRFARVVKDDVKIKRTDKDERWEGMMGGSKWTLDEANETVALLRSHNMSIWAGVSGTTRYILDLSRHVLGEGNYQELWALTHCVFAFFRFMPTSISATHTFAEVLMSAQRVDPRIEPAWSVGVLPKLDLTVGGALG